MTAFLRGLLLDLLYLPAIFLCLPWLAYLVVVKRRGVGALKERLGGWSLPPPRGRRIWIHCVSVGELQAVGPLLEELARAEDETEFVLSVTTTTAREIARARYPDIPTFLYPVDVSLCVRRVLGRVQPSALVLIELEVWPQMVLLARAREIPIVVVNGRISDRSFPRLRRVRWLARPIFSRLTEVHARDRVCSERFVALGVPSAHVFTLGNLKLDRAPLEDPGAVRRRYETQFGYSTGALRWVAGCTHPGEETVVLQVHRALRARFPELTLLLAPRHVERSDAVIALVAEQGFTVVSAGEVLDREPSRAPTRTPAPEVVVLDRTGRLAELYSVGDAAFVGGSLIERGGHNILEPVLAAVATYHGPCMANFRELVEWLDGGGGDGIGDGRELGGRDRSRSFRQELAARTHRAGARPPSEVEGECPTERRTD